MIHLAITGLTLNEWRGGVALTVGYPETDPTHWIHRWYARLAESSFDYTTARIPASSII